MTTDERVTYIRDELLNRPSEDDLFTSPTSFYDALTRAANHYYQKVAAHFPELLYQTETVTSDADGDTYTLSDDHIGELEVWAPPGPPSGRQLSNVLPDSGAFGFYIEGRDLRLTHARVYSPGLYIRWVPATVTPLDATTASPLPLYCEEAECLHAAYLLSKKPGFLGNPEDFRIRARNAWAGDPDDPSDMGVLGIISRQAATQGHQTAAGSGYAPWWSGIPG
jgi:hypothetical protein